MIAGVLSPASDIFEVTIGTRVVGWLAVDGWHYSAQLFEDENEDVVLRVKRSNGDVWHLPPETNVLALVAAGKTVDVPPCVGASS